MINSEALQDYRKMCEKERNFIGKSLLYHIILIIV